jgi:choline/glycine/proline betaine transport protein
LAFYFSLAEYSASKKTFNLLQFAYLMSIKKPVFFSSISLIFSLLILGVFFPSQVENYFNTIQSSIIVNFDWFYILSVAIFFIFCLLIAMSGYGDIKLGSDHDEPDFSYSAWFAMLFSAGMGIGLLFFGVAEPLMHYIAPPTGEAETARAASDALSITFFHWGLHAWAIYTVAGLTLAYFCFRQELPLTFRSALHPLLGDKVYAWPGDVVDTVAVISTLFGIATTLGFGTAQISSGLQYLFSIPDTTYIRVAIIVVICCISALSAASGLKRGVRRLSEINILLAIGLLLFVFLFGPTAQLLSFLMQNIGNYLSSLTERTFNLYAYDPTGWIGGWTLFYWGWWISWSPFVGMFIARISRGRTIREFILGVMLVPVLFTFVWMTVFGNTAILFDTQTASLGVLSSAVNSAPESGLYALLNMLPLSHVTMFITLLVIAMFFITSADSGALVIDGLTSGGKTKLHIWQRTFWVFIIGLVAVVVMMFGGLEGLQTASIIAALPFSVILLVACYGLFQALKLEKLKKIAGSIAYHSFKPIKRSWKSRLKTIVNYPDKTEAVKFLNQVVLNAANKVTSELAQQEVCVALAREENEIAITIQHGEEAEFYYAVRLKGYSIPSFAITEDDDSEENEQTRFYRAEVHLTEGGQNYDIMGYSEEDVITDILMQYDKHLHYLHLSS